MFAKLDFRVTPLSLACLFVGCVLLTIGVKLADTFDVLPIGWFLSSLEAKTAVTIWTVGRALSVLLVSVFFFRSHLGERPGYFWWTWSASVTGSTLPWLFVLLLNINWMFPPTHLSVAEVVKGILAVLGIAHVFALMIFAFVFDWDEPATSKSA